MRGPTLLLVCLNRRLPTCCCPLRTLRCTRQSLLRKVETVLGAAPRRPVLLNCCSPPATPVGFGCRFFKMGGNRAIRLRDGADAHFCIVGTVHSVLHCTVQGFFFYFNYS